ncbi:apolipoprotein A-I-like [Oncorhynchus keta]|uniref:apolipoprotein A-I-like n=1 Tax=Oncorhynchus keta TaxID=8018 RepID=UPI0015FA9113|nr:apolipoprotein A-I-like [Oncorhynchus keta]
MCQKHIVEVFPEKDFDIEMTLGQPSNPRIWTEGLRSMSKTAHTHLIRDHTPQPFTMKMKLSESFDKLHEYTQTASTSNQVCEKVMADVENLRTKLKPKSEELQQVLQKHVEMYREKLEPIFQEYVSLHTADLQSELEPYFEDLKSRFMTFYDIVATAMKA